MNTTSWENYGNGDDPQRHLRNRSSTVAATTAHSNVPMSLMPGRISHQTALPNFYVTAASRRMSIADDIRNAHNIPPLPPKHPSYAGAEFQPRPAPPVPTPPPPLPPLPPSLATTAYMRTSKTISPPPIPPKPFPAPSLPHEYGRAELSTSNVPRALMPGGRLLEPIADEGDLAIAMALSASVSKEEQSLRQKLASQEEEDIAKALEASMSEAGPPAQLDNVFARSLRDPSTQTITQSLPSQGHKDSIAEAPAHLLDVAPSSTSSDRPYLELSDSHSNVKDPDPSLGSEIAVSPGGGLVPPATILSVNGPLFILSPLTPSDFAYMRPEEEQDGTITPRGESEASHTKSFYSSPTTYPSQLPESNLNETSPSSNDLSAIGTAGQHLDHRDAFQSVPVGSVSTSSQEQAVNTMPDLPKYSPRADPPPILPTNANVEKQNPAHGREIYTTEGSSSGTSGIVHSSEGMPSELTLPSYTKTHTPTEDPLKLRSAYVTDAPSVPIRTRAQSHVQSSRPSSSHASTSRSSSASASSVSTMFSRPPSISTASSMHHDLPHPPSHIELRTAPLSRILSSESLSDTHSNDLDSARPNANQVNHNAFVNRELLNGVSVGFMAPKISSQLVSMVEDMPPIISLPYGKARPLHLQGPSWRHLLKLMASLSGTRMEASLEAVAATKTPPKLRTVIQFIKPQYASSVWRTVFYFSVDYPTPQPQIRHRSVNDLPFSYSLAGPPTLLRDASDSPTSKTYTIPASDSVPYPTLPISFPDLAMYMQAALDESRRYLHDSHSDYRKLAKMVAACYPDEGLPQAPTDRRGLFMRVMGLSNKTPKRSGNEDTYELVTPFVPDEWG